MLQIGKVNDVIAAFKILGGIESTPVAFLGLSFLMQVETCFSVMILNSKFCFGFCSLICLILGWSSLTWVLLFILGYINVEYFGLY